MSQDPTKEADFDLDEDLFNFEEVAGPAADADYDLDEIFASFEDAEQEAAQAPAPPPAESAPTAEPAAPLPTPAADAAPSAAPAPHPAVTPDAVSAPAAPQAPAPPATAAAAAPAPVPVAPAAVIQTVGAGNKGIVWALILIGSLNALVALVVVKSLLTMQGELADVGNEVTHSTREVLQDVRSSVDALGTDPLPEVPPNPEEHPTFAAAREEIDAGRYADARQRLYALLAIVDRFDPVTRAEVEARANYLLAEATHLEAIRALSEEQR